MNKNNYFTFNLSRVLVLIFSVIVFGAVIIIPLSLTDYIFAFSENSYNIDTAYVHKSSSSEAEQIINDLFEKLQNMEEEKVNISEEIENIKQDIDGTIETKTLLDKKVELTESQINTLDDIIAKYDELIAQKQAEIDVIQSDYDNKYDVFKNRLRQSYEEGTPGILDIFFNSDDFLDVLSSLERMNDILSYDNRLMSELNDSYNVLKAEKESIEGYKSLRVSAQDRLYLTKMSLDSEISDSLQYISDLENDISSFNSYLAQLDIEQENINETLIELIKEYKNNYGDHKFEYEQSKLYKEYLYKDSIIESMTSDIIQKGSDYFEDGAAFIFPISNTSFSRGYLSSYFGWRTYKNQYGEIVTSNHKGIDVAVPYASPIYASASGYVVTAEYSNGYGYYITILHDGDIQTRYAHASKLLVSVGDYVMQGEVIAYVGATGNATGNHCHFEVIILSDDKAVNVNPLDYVSVPSK